MHSIVIHNFLDDTPSTRKTMNLNSVTAQLMGNFTHHSDYFVYSIVISVLEYRDLGADFINTAWI